MRLSQTALLLGASLLVTGCASEDTSAPKLGDLGRGVFRYRCVSDDDAACAAGAKEVDFNFPSAIATGGRFELAFAPKSEKREAIGNAVLKPASAEYLDDAAIDFFVARRAGRVAVVARSSSTGKVADFTYVRIADPRRVRILTASDSVAPASIEARVGEPLTLRADALGALEETLAGTIDFKWSTTSDAVLDLEASNPATRMVFDPKAPGDVKVNVELGGLTASVDVRVSP